jgi:hypothetical protein
MSLHSGDPYSTAYANPSRTVEART